MDVRGRWAAWLRWIAAAAPRDTRSSDGPDAAGDDDAGEATHLVEALRVPVTSAYGTPQSSEHGLGIGAAMTRKPKLELTWIGKENRPRLEPRILLEDRERSHHAAHRVTDHDLFDNRLIFGDNLLALKALEQEFAGKVKCVFIDPPYNTGSAFEHYDDGVEHSLWLSLMRDRLEILRAMLAKDGAIWISVDDNEGHYLKVLCDEVFGRRSFVATVVWENFYGRSNAAAISPAHNYLLVYSPLGLEWKHVRRLLPRDEKSSSKYSNPDGDARGPWRLGPIFAAEERHEGLMYTITTPAGREVKPPRGSHWRMIETDFWKLVEEGRITFGAGGDNVPAVKLYLSEVQDGLVPRTWWPHTEVGHSQEAKREIQSLFPDTIPFGTPKPERLLQRVVEMSTHPGDLVLDSFAGSGTTGAVAHKMGRRWIMVELGEHCHTHIIPRMQKVIDGQDPGGITESVGWKGGGGFRYYRLAPSLLEKDKWGNWVISREYNAAMLAEAICKLEGFSYAPSDTVYWQHGFSTERDFLYVTTAHLTHDQLQQLSDEVGEARSLLVVCSAFRGKKGGYPNLTVKKIPAAVLGRCEWGKDDYSLKVENLPKAPVPAGQQELDL
jgi:adenine-specific DNA-methyltransferase